MSAWTNGTYTHKGLALLSKLTQGNSLKITRAVTGTGYVTPANLANQSAVTGIKQTLSFKAATYPETGMCKLPMFVKNEGLKTGYIAKQIGLYALDPDEGEILYFIAQSQNGTQIPSEAEMPEYSSTWTFYFRYGQADNVNVTVDPSHTVTEDMLNEVRIIAETGVSDANHGKAIVLDNTANLPFVNLKLYGKTTQIGTPTPENPADLIGVENPVVSVTGLNIWDEETELGYWQSVNGEAYTATNQIRSKNFIPIIPNATIYVTAPNNKTIDFVFYDRHKSFLSGRSVARVITAPSEAYYMHINLRSDYGTTYKNNVCVSMIPLNGAYEKTSGKQTIAIPHTLHGIPVASGGNYTDTDGQQWVCDEIDFEKGVLVTRVGRVDLGTLAFELAAGIFRCVLPSDFAFTYGVPNLLCAKYETVFTGSATVWAEYPDKVVGYRSDSWLMVKDSDYTDAATFKAAMSGVTLYYELATPIETALSFAELEAYNALKSNNPHTTIINDGGANMEADCFLAQHETAFERIFNNTNTKAKKATEITDNAVAMVKDVHEDSAPYAKVLEIGGVTRKCTNLLKFPYIGGDSKTVNGVTFTANSDGSITISGTNTHTTYVEYPLITTNSLVMTNANVTVSLYGSVSDDVYCTVGGGGFDFYEIKAGSSTTLMNNGTTNMFSYALLRVKVGATVSNVTVYPMFNDGKTALPYEPYFDGLRSAPVTEVESVGVNLIPFPYTHGNNRTTQGITFTVDAEGKISAKGTWSGNTPAWHYLYDDSNGFVMPKDGILRFTITNNNSGTRLKPSVTINGKAKYDESSVKVNKGDVIKRIAVYTDSSTAIAIDSTATVMLNYGTTALPYTPYRRNTLPIPAEVQALDGYGWGVNDTLYNYIDFEKKQFVKRVGRVDLGALDWKINASGSVYSPYFYANFSGIKYFGSFYSNVYPIITAPYKTTSRNNLADDGITVDGIEGEAQQFQIKDSAYTDAATFKSAMSGVMLYYELAEPVVTDISDLLPDDNLIGVEGGGTVTMVNEYGFDMPNTVEFSIGNNAAVGSRSFVGDLHGTAARAKADENGKPLATQEWVLEQLASLAAATLALNQ